MKTIDDFLTLHRHLKVIYIVDGYLAKLVNDSEEEIAEVEADTVENAIKKLVIELELIAGV